MAKPKDTTIAMPMEQRFKQLPECMAEVFINLFNIVMRLERERFLGATHYERPAEGGIREWPGTFGGSFCCTSSPSIRSIRARIIKAFSLEPKKYQARQ